MEITELPKIIAWSLLAAMVIAACFISLFLIAAGRAAQSDRERNEAYDEASS